MERSQSLYALVDCNNFYVSCERVFNPSLEKKPVVILSNNDGCIISRSNEVKALGVPMAGPYHESAAVLEKNKAVVLSSNYTLYGDMSARVMSLLMEAAPEVELYSIDEAFLKWSHTDLEKAQAECAELRKRIKQWLGLPVSIGLAPTKTLAKAASIMAKKNSDGVFGFQNQNAIDDVLKDFPARWVWGIGSNLAAALKRKNIHTAFALKNAPDSWVKKHLTVMGLRLVMELRGYSCLPLETLKAPRKAILCSRSFGKSVSTLSDLLEATALHATRAAEKLRSQKARAGYLQVFLRTNSYQDAPQYHSHLGEELALPTNDTSVLITRAQALVREIYKSGYRYKKTGVMLSALSPADSTQGHLFEDAVNEKREKLMQVLDRINHSFGSHTLHFAATGIQRQWRMKQEHISPRYTTDWREIPRVKA